MTAAQLAWWEEYATLEPFGPLRDDERAGVIASAAVSPYLKPGRTAGPADFFGSLKGSKQREQTAEEQVMAARGWCLMVGGRIEEPGEAADGVDRRTGPEDHG